MFELDETQRLVEAAARAWCEQELAPHVPALEAGERLPYDLLRGLATDLAISEPLVRAAERRISRLRAAAAPGAAPGRAQGDVAARDVDREAGAGSTGSAGAARGAEVAGADAGGADSDTLGGTGDPLHSSILLKEISRVSPGFGMALVATLGCAMAIVARGSAELILRYAIPVLRFAKVGAWGLTEPGAGSDAFGSMRTTATVDGDDLVLDGQKTFISNAPYADVFVIYTRIADRAASQRKGEAWPIRPVVVERGTPGLETGKPLRKMGMHDSPTGEIFLSGCRVPRSQMIGTLEEGATARGGAALETLNLERAVMPAMCLGIIERCVEESARYARTRVQFGQPIAEFQGVAFKLARMELALENARNLVLKLAWAQREGKLDSRLTSLAKLYCAEQAVRVSLDAIQIHGGAGYMADLPLEKLMRDAKMFEIGGGTNEIQLQTIARSLLK